jgi:hypothetical protein
MLARIKRTYIFPAPQTVLGSAGQGALQELSAALMEVLSMELPQKH